MLEKEIIEKAIIELKASSGMIPISIWRAPAFKMMRWDVFGVFDLVSVNAMGTVCFIQCTSTPNLSARRNKILAYYGQIGFKIPNAYIYAWSNKKNGFIIELV